VLQRRFLLAFLSQSTFSFLQGIPSRRVQLPPTNTNTLRFSTVWRRTTYPFPVRTRMEMEKLTQGFQKLQASDSKSLLKKYLTPELFQKLKDRQTPLGAGLLDVVQSGEP